MTLNDPQFVEAARRLAQRTLAEAAEADDARIDFMARRLLARPLRDAEEAEVVRGSLDRLVAYYQSHPDDAAKLLIAVGESTSRDAGRPATPRAPGRLDHARQRTDEPGRSPQQVITADASS